MYSQNDIAIVSVACRFPDAETPEQFWDNLVQGKLSVRNLDDDYLISRGATKEDIAHPNYVKKAVIVDDIDKFDAAFFGFTPREAELLDPQQRLFLIICWEAFERASIIPGDDQEATGVFAGVSFNTYLLQCLDALRENKPDLLSKIGGFQSLIHSDKDFIATRTSFKLNLSGPSYTIQSACSTSLLAVHQACQSLLSYECDLALAGGASISVPQNLGYFHQEGMIFSPDGCCRPFDKDAQGTLVGNGVGVVLLKRACDAVEDKNPILAIIKGSAVNNDGCLKVGFTAPSRQGQTAVIREAIDVTGIRPENIGYVEAHGTGTTMGDPIEIAALTKAYETDKKQYCRIGSVKSNIGHLDAAAGVAGLIKLTLMLHHRQFVPSINYTSPNENIDFSNSPFQVSSDSSSWQRPDGSPRTAGISAFGIGGTNVHLILQENELTDEHVYPESSPTLLIPISAKSDYSLHCNILRFKEFSANSHNLSLADFTKTLQLGRMHFVKRRGYVCTSVQHLINQIEQSHFIQSPNIGNKKSASVWFFSGQGSQFQKMFSGLYGRAKTFTSVLNECSEKFRQKFNLDIIELITNHDLSSTDIAQPVIFSVQIALARQLEAYGIQPDALVGHSIGEYAAACFADVISLDDAIEMVFWRGKYMAESESGSMLSVSGLPSSIAVPAELTIAVHNGSDNVVLSGTVSQINSFHKTLESSDVTCRLLKTSHAYHSSMMQDAADRYLNKIKQVRFHKPRVRIFSSMTGELIADENVIDTDYWVNQIVNPVRFDLAVNQIYRVFEHDLKQLIVPLEIGPAAQLSSLLKRRLRDDQFKPVSCSKTPNHNADDQTVLLEAINHLWMHGIDFEWSKLQTEELSNARFITLPTYAFERSSHWLGDIEDACPSTNDQESQWDFIAKTNNAFDHPHQNSNPPTTDVQICLSEIWQEQLGIKNIGIEHGFFDLGGDSLQATQVVSTINGIFNIKIKSAELRQHSTIKELAELIELRILHFVAALTDDDALTLLTELGQA